MNKIIENIKSGNYEVVDNQGVSVTQHFIDCLEKEFADLEAKLAESEKHRKEAYKEGLLQKQFDKDTEIMQLKQQLEEKEQIIEANKVKIKSLSEMNLLLKSDVQMAVKIQNKHNQDKISFAVDKLVGVQKYIDDNAVYIEEESFGREINDFIDNQINELKEGK